MPETGHCVVIGAGLAGAAAAASLSRRGWRVTVLDAAMSPASGASAVPVGLLAPHYSPDDALLSRLSRAGVHITLQAARDLLQEGVDWAMPGVLEVRTRIAPDEAHGGAMRPWSRRAGEDAVRAARLAPGTSAVWHERAGWIKPSALVRAWLAQPGVTWRGGCEVASIVRVGDEWSVQDAAAKSLDAAPLIVVAASLGSAHLLKDAVSLHPVRGQVSWAPRRGESLTPFPLNGNGHFIPDVPQEDGSAWFCGSTFGPGDDDVSPRDTDHGFNLQRLEGLAPAAARELAPVFAEGAVRAWAGVRCASSDRRPLLGEIQPGLWVSTALGSRGLTFAALCGELLAARIHGEPLPLDPALAKAMDAKR